MRKKRHRVHKRLRSLSRALRRQQTPPEKNLWRELRSRQLSGVKFRRQHSVGRFIVDFYCAQCKLIVELDGESHVERTEYDTSRTQWLTSRGYRVIRFTNREITKNLTGVLEAILEACDEGRDSLSPWGGED